MKANMVAEKRVGIITLSSQFNYGNRLQNYAIIQLLERLGFKSDSLAVGERFNLMRTLHLAYYGLMGMKREPLPEELMSQERIEAFNRFNMRVPIRQIPRANKQLSSEYALFSVGSDQVWNPGYMAYNEDYYFLTFARPSQRIALAPSIGLDTLTPKQARRIARGVAGFPSLSVREQRGAELIKECSGRTATVVCDPALTLSAAEWRAVADDRLTPGEPYVFTYLLGGVGPEAADVLETVTAHGRIPVIPLSDREKPEEPPAGPAEFISLIDSAAHVVTDSFHAAVFSSILQTPLTIVHRQGGASMFSRLETLSHMLGIEEKVYGAPEYDLARAGDYDGVPEAIARERANFMGYLEGCLDNQLPGWREGARG